MAGLLAAATRWATVAAAGLLAAATRWATVAAAGLLAAAAIAWAAIPLHDDRAGTKIALIIAVVAGTLSIVRLALVDLEQLTATSAAQRFIERLLTVPAAVPWAEGMLLAVLVLEVLHPARPWHTAVLGLALLGYLFATHLAETRATPKVLRGQLPLLAAGVGLLALAVGAAALPGLPGAAGSLLASAVTVVAAVLVAALALPGIRRGDR